MRRKLITTVGTVACVTAIVATIGAETTSASPSKRLGETLVVIQSPPRQQYVDLGNPAPHPVTSWSSPARSPTKPGPRSATSTSRARRTSTRWQCASGSSTCPGGARSQSTPRPCSPTQRWEWSPAEPASFRRCEAKPTSILSPTGRPRSRSTSSGSQAAAPASASGSSRSKIRIYASDQCLRQDFNLCSRLRRGLLCTPLTSGNEVPHIMIGGPSGATAPAVARRRAGCVGGPCCQLGVAARRRL